MEVPATAGHKRKGASEDGDTPAIKKATKIATQVQGPLNVSPELADSTNGERSLETNARRNDPLAVSPELDDSTNNKRGSNGVPKKPKWFVEQQVFVKLVDSSWVLGQIVDVKEKGTTIDGTFYDYAVCVQAEKEDGSDVHLELPKPSIAKHLRGYDEFLYSLPPDQQLHLRCMRANKSKRSKRVPSRAVDDSKAGEKGPSLDATQTLSWYHRIMTCFLSCPRQDKGKPACSRASYSCLAQTTRLSGHKGCLVVVLHAQLCCQQVVRK